MFDHVHIPARRLLPGLVAAMALLAMAGTASAATPPGHYTIRAAAIDKAGNDSATQVVIRVR
jgi:hypothetical protein